MTSIAIFEAVNTISLPFHGQKIITAMVAGVAYVAMKPIVENIGLDWKSQYAKLVSQREKFGCGDITIPTKGGVQQMLCIPLKKLNGWLFSINPAKVRDAVREGLIRYQEECFTALHDYWSKGVATNPRTPKKQEDKKSRYHVRVIVYDNLFGGCVEFQGRADTFRGIASGVATDMGFKPTGFIEQPYAVEKMRKVY
ncbi:hypothetical protein DSJ_12265 [Pantoea stewartii subsp. stewartii DC283]|uniref:Antirepressor protein ant N-terminal domain-containing protein n=2 Tax=Pantoea stewartii subsp. stewartii DC283 TaxID=660596 RepID=A0ABN4Z2P5_PANSE|nr:hypothetical protein DSJ_12265 [Pantoea stewartii subsp. stewartii DC283]